jgi:hypothetical protein
MLTRMVSALAASALQRRFLLGPMIALALVSAGDETVPSNGATPVPTASASASPAVDAAVVKRALTLAHEAQAVYYVENMVYLAGVGDELAELKAIEPKIAWGTQVIVQFPVEEATTLQVFILRAPLPTGESLCIAEVSEVEDAGTYYARVAAGATCPAHKPGMPGWATEETVGWGG